MSITGVKPDHFTHTLLVDLYSKKGEREEFLTILEAMKLLGFVLNETIYSSVINMLEGKGKKEDALLIFDDMTSQAIVPSRYI